MAAFRRPGSRSALGHLYLAGGSVHPGPGVPMAVLSGRQAAASLLKDLAST
jgi:1-hydroxycarotenoid 3,4-desaturase